MGEIGIQRRDFLYELRFWEVRRIIRGYRRRGLLIHQLIAQNIYATTFMMQDPKGKTVGDLFPFLFDDEEIEASLSEDESNDMVDIINNINAAKEKSDE